MWGWIIAGVLVLVIAFFVTRARYYLRAQTRTAIAENEKHLPRLRQIIEELRPISADIRASHERMANLRERVKTEVLGYSRFHIAIEPWEKLLADYAAKPTNDYGSPRDRDIVHDAEKLEKQIRELKPLIGVADRFASAKANVPRLFKAVSENLAALREKMGHEDVSDYPKDVFSRAVESYLHAESEINREENDINWLRVERDLERVQGVILQAIEQAAKDAAEIAELRDAIGPELERLSSEHEVLAAGIESAAHPSYRARSIARDAGDIIARAALESGNDRKSVLEKKKQAGKASELLKTAKSVNDRHRALLEQAL